MGTARRAPTPLERRVYTGAGEIIPPKQNPIARLLEDQRSGSSFIAERAARLLIDRARALAQAGCDGTVIADAACGSWITRCGAVLLGADWLTGVAS